jgi:homocitrate synthase NifV
MRATVGYAIPSEFGALVGRVKERIGDSAVISIHCHNDLGLATANTLAAIRAGASAASVTVLGLGERAGNAPLEEIAVALPRTADARTGVDPTRLMTLCQLVAKASRDSIPRAKPIVGADIFTHESGIHVAGLLHDVRTYQGLDPALLGRRHKVVIGKHSGLAAVRSVCAAVGLDLDGPVAARVLARVKDIAKTTKTLVPDARVRSVARQELDKVETRDVASAPRPELRLHP